LAAETHVDRSIDDPSAFITTNVVGSFGLLETARRYWSQLGGPAREEFRLLHVSTDEVYGSIAAGARADEEALLVPSSPYSAAQAAPDQPMGGRDCKSRLTRV